MSGEQEAYYLFTLLKALSPPSVSNKHTQHPSIPPDWEKWWSNSPSQWDSSHPGWLDAVCVIWLTLASNRTARRPLENTHMCRASKGCFPNVIYYRSLSDKTIQTLNSSQSKFPTSKDYFDWIFKCNLQYTLLKCNHYQYSFLNNKFILCQ